MKKIGIYSVATAMLFLGVISCSKKDDSSSSSGSTSSTSSTSSTTATASTATTSTTSSTASTSSTGSTSATTADLNTVKHDGLTAEFVGIECQLASGSNNVYTMHGDDADGTLFDAKFIGTPVAGTYEITLTPPTTSSTVQLNVTLNSFTQYTAKPITGGVHTATVTIDNGQPHLTFTDATFVKASTTKIMSGNIMCQ